MQIFEAQKNSPINSKMELADLLEGRLFPSQLTEYSKIKNPCFLIIIKTIMITFYTKNAHVKYTV